MPVAEPATTSAVVRFGVFEVDLRAGELRKNGSKLKLAGQPFQVLTILLERPREVVTRCRSACGRTLLSTSITT